MKVVIAGSTGMIGNLVLTNCLNSPQITEIISLVRKLSGQQHNKLTEYIISDFEDYSQHEKIFNNTSIAFFCLGVYTGQVPDDIFKKITVNYAIEFANAVANKNANATLCLLSGAGADRTEKSKTPFARYKGMAENALFKLTLKTYSFRPGYIYPVVPREEPNFGYRIFRALYPLVKRFGKKYSIPSTDLANAMFHVGMHGADKSILENQDILVYSKIK